MPVRRSRGGFGAAARRRGPDVYDFNIGSVIRSANAFLAKEVVIYGRRKADLRGAMGSYIYESIVHLADAAALDAFVEERGYTIVCLAVL